MKQQRSAGRDLVRAGDLSDVLILAEPARARVRERETQVACWGEVKLFGRRDRQGKTPIRQWAMAHHRPA